MDKKEILQESQRWLDIISTPELSAEQKATDRRRHRRQLFVLLQPRLPRLPQVGRRDAREPGTRVGRPGLDVPRHHGPRVHRLPRRIRHLQRRASGTRRSSRPSPTSSRAMPLSSQELLDPLRGALAELLGEITPGDLQYSFFINNGTDAVEGAIKLARIYTGKTNFISSLRGFHGKSCGSLSLLGKWRVPRAVPAAAARHPVRRVRRRRRGHRRALQGRRDGQRASPRSSWSRFRARRARSCRRTTSGRASARRATSTAPC